jgi:hypothetical protein
LMGDDIILVSPFFGPDILFYFLSKAMSSWVQQCIKINIHWTLVLANPWNNHWTLVLANPWNSNWILLDSP